MGCFAPFKAKRPTFSWTRLPLTKTTSITTMASNLQMATSNPDEEWNGNRHRKGEERKKEQQEKEEVDKNKKEHCVQKDYYPPSPTYDPNFKDTMPTPIKNKQDLDPNYYPSNYVLNYGEDATPWWTI